MYDVAPFKEFKIEGFNMRPIKYGLKKQVEKKAKKVKKNKK